MSYCWELRGCDAEMQSRCPHNIPGEPCPSECNFAACDRPTHVVAQGFALLDNPDVDRAVAAKEVCRVCTFFIGRGPKVGSAESKALAEEIAAYEAAGGFRAKFGNGNLGVDGEALTRAAAQTAQAAQSKAAAQAAAAGVSVAGAAAGAQVENASGAATGAQVTAAGAAAGAQVETAPGGTQTGAAGSAQGGAQ